MEYLVTGGAGFIGSNLVRRLVEDGCRVRVLDNLATGRLTNLDGLLDSIEWIEGDIRDAATAAAAVDGVRHVLHLAALPSVIRSVRDPVAANDVNINGTLTMLVASRDAGVERFVYSSSSSVYGDTAVLPKREDMTPMPLSPYAAQKLAGEHYARIFHSLYGLKTFALRYFNVFGPNQDPASQYAAVIPLFIAALRDGRPPTIFGDGEQTRDFTFVSDVVEANLACCSCAPSAAGAVYNVAGNRRTSVNELARLLAGCLGKTIEPRYAPARPGDVRDSQGDPARARERLGWEVRVPLAAGLEATAAAFPDA